MSESAWHDYARSLGLMPKKDPERIYMTERQNPTTWNVTTIKPRRDWKQFRSLWVKGRGR
jgi:hypothetical protein